ncbi:MAG: hypothetical protein VX938_05775, partial [Myxococcota bacterium]|nr:hypothetical protein [Myxococcota bacterium]
DKSLLERTGYVRLPLARRDGLAEGLQFLDIKAYLSGAVTLEDSDVIRMDHLNFVAEVPLAAIKPRDTIDQVVKSLTTPWGMLKDQKVSVDAFNVLWGAVEVPYGPREESMAVLALDNWGNVLAKGEGKLTYGVRVERSDRAQCTIDIMDRGDASDSVDFTFLGPARPELVKKFQVVNQGTHFIQERFRANKKCAARAEDGTEAGKLVACTAP